MTQVHAMRSPDQELCDSVDDAESTRKIWDQCFTFGALGRGVVSKTGIGEEVQWFSEVPGLLGGLCRDDPNRHPTVAASIMIGLTNKPSFEVLRIFERLLTAHGSHVGSSGRGRTICLGGRGLAESTQTRGGSCARRRRNRSSSDLPRNRSWIINLQYHLLWMSTSS